MKTHIFSIQTLIVAKAGDNVELKDIITSIDTSFEVPSVVGSTRVGGYKWKGILKPKLKYLGTRG